MDKKQIQIPIKKMDDDKRQVFGFASVIMQPDGSPLVDQQGDIIPEHELEEAAYRFNMDYRVGMVQHEGTIIAYLIESFVITQAKAVILGFDMALGVDMPIGWWVGFHVVDDEVWARIKNGELRMFSIGGYAERVA